jgi:1-acyl-sn-glycerol-3-phosphate acyltransferase
MHRVLSAMLFFVINVLQALFVVVWSVGWMGSAIIVRLLTGDAERALAMARWGYSPLLIRLTGARFEVEQLPELDWSKPYVVVMNHQSMLDILCAFAALPMNLRFVAKHTLQYVPFLGWYMWATGMVFVDRKNRTQAVGSLGKAAQRVRDGATVIAFPEGTRSRGEPRVMAFKKGPFMLAIEAGVPLLPVAIHGSGEVLPSDGMRIRPGTIRLKVGTPIPTAGCTAEQRDALMESAREQIVRMNMELGGLGAEESPVRALPAAEQQRDARAA